MGLRMQQYFNSTVSTSAEHTCKIATQFVTQLQGGDTVFLQGNLGVGKTTFCQGLLAAMGYTKAVQSPTFALVNSYPLLQWTVNHFDLYRCKSSAELEAIGYRDYLSPNDIQLIEWPEKAIDYLPQPEWVVELSYQQHNRLILIQCLKK